MFCAHRWRSRYGLPNITCISKLIDLFKFCLSSNCLQLTKNVWIFIFKGLYIIPGILHSIEASDSKTSYNSGILGILSTICLAPPPPPLHPALDGDKKCFQKMEKRYLQELTSPAPSIPALTTLVLRLRRPTCSMFKMKLIDTTCKPT